MTATLTVRMLVALGLTWSIGFERELRGAAAGDRTISLVGLGSAVIGYLALHRAPHALAGVITGVGFIGAGVIVHSVQTAPEAATGPAPDAATGPAPESRRLSAVHGVTTAATIYLAAAIGAAAGQGYLLLALEATVACLLLLEVRHLVWLRWLDGRYWRDRLNIPDDDRADL